jgi:hypothetical protein
VRIDEHIDVKNQDVKSRRMAGLIEKIAHFQIGNQFVLVLISAWARIDPSPVRAFLLQII